jgi:polar amino acid transport system permease protein
MYLIPYQVHIFGFVATTPDWIKATLGFALPVTAYVAEITRGGIMSLPSAQWDSGESLALTRWQIMWMVIIPQCAKRMLPPWMNLYAFVTISTVLVNIVGITDILTAAREALNSDGRSELILPMYGYVLLWFFVYCYPIATLTTYLERRWAVRS